MWLKTVAYLNEILKKIIKLQKKVQYFIHTKYLSTCGMYFGVYFVLHVPKRILWHMARFEGGKKNTMALFLSAVCPCHALHQVQWHLLACAMPFRLAVIFSPQYTIGAWKNVSELYLWQITSLDRSMKEHKILRQPPSEWTCLRGLNDVLVPATAFLLGNVVSLAVPITWFISQVSEATQGWEKEGDLQDWACLLNAGLLIQLLQKKKKMISQEFSNHHWSISACIMQYIQYVYVCLFSQFKRIYSLDESCSDIIPHLYYLPSCPVLLQ